MEVRVGQVWTKKSNSGIHFHITRKYELKDPNINYFLVDIYLCGEDIRIKQSTTGFQDTMIEFLCDPPKNDLIETLDRILNEDN